MLDRLHLFVKFRQIFDNTRHMVRRPTQQITTQLAEAALLLAKRRGASTERICASANYRHNVYEGQDLVSFQHFGELLDACAQELDDPHFGLNLGGVSDFRAVGTIAYTMSNAPTIHMALHNLVRYQSSFSRGFGVFFEATDKLAVGFILPNTDTAGMRHFGEMCLAIAINTMRSLIEERWLSAGAHFQHEMNGTIDDYEPILGCVPKFSCRRTEMIVSTQVAEEVIPFADRTVLPIIERQLASIANAYNENTPLLSEIRMEIARTLCDGAPTINDIAERLQLSSRTLQRRLLESGSGFRDLLCEVRKQLAQEYLRIASVDLLEVSLLLGYSDLSAFDHAFLDWFGESPSSFRKREAG